MDGLFFVWCSWIIVIYLFFFADKSKKSILVHVLVLLFMSQFILQLDSWTVNSACVYLFVIASLSIARRRSEERIRIYLTSFIVAILQGSYVLFCILEPLWFLQIPSWVIYFLLVYVCTLCIRKNANRILSLIMGKIISDILLFAVHLQNNLQYEYLQLAWFDQLAMICMFLLFWSIMESTGKFVFNHTRHTQKKEV